MVPKKTKSHKTNKWIKQLKKFDKKHHSVVLLLVLTMGIFTGMLISQSSTPITISVNSTADTPILTAAKEAGNCDVDDITEGDQCTLRAAIELANYRNIAGDTIEFTTLSAGQLTIEPTSNLTTITSSVIIDGTYDISNNITIDGRASSLTSGLELSGSSTQGSQIKNLSILGFSSQNIKVDNSTGGSTVTISNVISGLTSTGEILEPDMATNTSMVSSRSIYCLNSDNVHIDSSVVALGGVMNIEMQNCGDFIIENSKIGLTTSQATTTSVVSATASVSINSGSSGEISNNYIGTGNLY